MNLILSNTHTVHEFNGLYSLTDLHRASGSENKHKPNYFLTNQETKELIAEIESEKQIAYHTINGGNNRGTYACRELVIRYAMWISPKFSLMVIRAFDALNTGAVPCLDRPRLSDFQAFTLQKAVRAKCGGNRSHYQALYRTLYNAFGVNSYKNILAEDFDEAMAIVERFSYGQVPEISLYVANKVLGLCAIRLMEYSKLLSQLQDFGYSPNPAKQALNGLVELAEQLGVKDGNGKPLIRTNGVAWYHGPAMLFDH